MSFALQIRRGIPTDLPALQQLFADTVRLVCTRDYTERQVQIWAESVQDQTRWQRIVAEQYVVIAETAAGTVVGFATLADGHYLDLLYVHYAYQQRGVARLLYAAIEHEAQRTHCPLLTADVSLTARPFFERMGFGLIAEQQVTLQNVAFTNFRMAKPLQTPSATYL
jgi:putative acetyltransferase